MMARNRSHLTVRQQPQRAQVVQENNPKNRKPIDPPPIIELKYDDRDDPSNSQWLVSPRTFMMVTLVDAKEDSEASSKHLIGQTVSSLHRLKDITNKDGGFFVFGDVSARKLGSFKLRFSLFDSSKETEQVAFLGSVDSDVFQDFGSMSESTVLTRTFSDQGVKLRVRKDNRTISSIGSKRPYNVSPPEPTSASLHTGVYGGAVQEHHSASHSSPSSKRHRSSSAYDSAHLYSSMAGSDGTASPYSNTMPSLGRSWTNDQLGRSHNGYGQPAMSLSMSSRPSSRTLHSQSSWQSLPHQSALPSPSTTSSSQYNSYQSAGGHPSAMPYRDSGTYSSTPRHSNYYGNGYSYQTQAPYAAQAPTGDSHSAYSDLLPSSSLSEGYVPSSGVFGSESSEIPGSYASYLGDAQPKF